MVTGAETATATAIGDVTVIEVEIAAATKIGIATGTEAATEIGDITEIDIVINTAIPCMT